MHDADLILQTVALDDLAYPAALKTAARSIHNLRLFSEQKQAMVENRLLFYLRIDPQKSQDRSGKQLICSHLSRFSFAIPPNC
jgi:hypothetical protein